ncbi:MAG: GIDE domain-containing protein [Polyangiaceae bacterium]
MGAVAGLLICAGIIGLIVGIIYRVRAGRILDAPLATTGDVVARGAAVAGPKGQISAQGQVMVQQPLISPMQGIQCLYYELKVTASWKEGDTTKSKDIEHQKMAAQFAINDGSGPVWVDLREGGDFEPLQRREQSQETGLLKGIVGGSMMFGNYALNTGILSMGTKYTVEEKALPVQPSLYVCGKVADGGGMIVAPKWRNMLVSQKTRDQYLADATKTAKIALIGGGAGLGVGIILAIVASMMGPSKAELEAAAAASASAAAAQASAAAAAASASATATDEPAEAPSGTATAAAPVKAGTPTKATTATTAKSAAPTTTAAPTATTKKPTIILKPKK